MRKYFLVIPIFFTSCSLFMADPELLPEAEELVVEITKDILKKDSK